MNRDALNLELTKIALALGYEKWPLVRRVALTVATRSMFELHEHGWFQAASDFLTKVCRRFRLCDYREAARQHLNNI